MFASKHTTLKELHEDQKTFVIMFIIVNIAGVGIMAFDIEAATLVFVIATMIGVLAIIVAITYHGRLQRETMAKMLGKDFMEFCMCEYCEKERTK